ncbi:hypothetical protein [Burkholderia gladioli]|uniref:hypothetical protein n=1 Tax=Burkholderia gladioli TaxID=28095 RepID=UPI00163F6D1D|nr:hypothetical protein [Burkholderia gladioli]
MTQAKPGTEPGKPDEQEDRGNSTPGPEGKRGGADTPPPRSARAPAEGPVETEPATRHQAAEPGAVVAATGGFDKACRKRRS